MVSPFFVFKGQISTGQYLPMSLWPFFGPIVMKMSWMHPGVFGCWGGGQLPFRGVFEALTADFFLSSPLQIDKEKKKWRS